MMAGRIGRFRDPNYYRTCLEKPGQPTGYMSVQHEVTRSLAKESEFLDVPASSSHFRVQTNGARRDSPNDSAPAFVVLDGNYLSAWRPGDVFSFARTFAAMLDEK